MSYVITKSTAKRISDMLTENLIAREPNRETFFVSIFVLNNLIQDLSDLDRLCSVQINMSKQLCT